MTQGPAFASDGNASPSGLSSGCSAKTERLEFARCEYRDHRPHCAGLFTNMAPGVTGDRTLEFGATWKFGTRDSLFAKKSRCERNWLNSPEMLPGRWTRSRARQDES
jgi:hypothetical protein